MRIVFGTLRGHVPEQLGGSQQDMDGILSALVGLGHQCEAVAALQPGPRLVVQRALRRLSGRRWISWSDRRNGYPTHRAWGCLVPQLLGRRLDAVEADLVVADFKPDNALADEALRRGIPVLLRIVSVGSVDQGVPIPRNPLVRVFANSQFVASRVRARYGLECPVIYPLIRLEQDPALRDRRRTSSRSSTRRRARASTSCSTWPPASRTAVFKSSRSCRSDASRWRR